MHLKLSEIQKRYTYRRDMNSIQSNGLSALYLLSHPNVTYKKKMRDKSMRLTQKGSSCCKQEGELTLNPLYQKTVCDKLYVLTHEVWVHSNQIAWKGLADKLCLNFHCLMNNLINFLHRKLLLKQTAQSLIRSKWTIEMLCL